jgi:hypothetical protein
VPGLVEVGGERVAVSGGGLQAGMGVADAVLREPLGELGEAGLGVGEDLVAELTALTDEAGVGACGLPC